jgi:hypothetical protein
MEDLPPNRLRCRDCRQYRLIAKFPFDDKGYRLTCCTLCQARQVRRRAYKSKKQEMPENSTASTSSTGSTKVCTRCFVKRDLSLFGKFATCNLCRVISFAYIRDPLLILIATQIPKTERVDEGGCSPKSREYKARIVPGSDSRALG